jgi:hypothetical protein
MLAYRRVNASWLAVGAFCSSHRLVPADARNGLAALDSSASRDTAAIPDHAPSLSAIRICIRHRIHRTALRPRFLAPRLRW